MRNFLFAILALCVVGCFVQAQAPPDPSDIFFPGGASELFLWQHRVDADCTEVGDDVIAWPGYNYTYYTRHLHLPKPTCTASGVDFPGLTSVVMNSEQWPDGTHPSNLELAAEVGQPYMFGAVVKVRQKSNASTNGLFGGPHCGFNVNQGMHGSLPTTHVWAEHASPKGRHICEINPNSYNWVFILVCRFPDGSFGVNYDGTTTFQQYGAGDPSGVVNSGFIGASFSEGEAFDGVIRTLVFARSVDFEDFDFGQQADLVEYLEYERDLAITIDAQQQPGS